ncbi:MULTISPECIES: response regulator [unclassified Variovorax]|uniref:response regulator n=1 Tax=unclassified Variovorax TaxID=663243 RepID=UPI000F7E7E02|nr:MULTISPECIES: response regulator [unclassified Variovorax]RSZ37197.1 response regulator transcription factor [Variovorax sp. 553]RSZ38011.1 response regulator transcription factor [Variovorax sp. 679]
MNVLIVDDNKASADLLQEVLALHDHTALCTYTAQQALDAAVAGSFDAALIDLTLPDLPGTEVARRLRASTAAGTPKLLVAVSGFSAQDVGGQSAEGLFDHHLQKPVDIGELERILVQR